MQHGFAALWFGLEQTVDPREGMIVCSTDTESSEGGTCMEMEMEQVHITIIYDRHQRSHGCSLNKLDIHILWREAWAQVS